MAWLSYLSWHTGVVEALNPCELSCTHASAVIGHPTPASPPFSLQSDGPGSIYAVTLTTITEGSITLGS